MSELPERRVAGQLFAVSEGLFIVRYPLSTALPIPLRLRGGHLLTWAFCGLGPSGADPAALIVFTADAPPESLTVETHFHDLAVTVPPVQAGTDLDPAARAALCPAVLGALAPATVAPLAGMLPLLGAALSALAESRENPSGPRPGLTPTGGTGAILTGSRVPGYLVLRAGARWRCLRIAGARLSFGAEPRAVLDLAEAGGPPEGPAEAALLVWPGEIVAAEVRS